MTGAIPLFPSMPSRRAKWQLYFHHLRMWGN